jgi:hypothetical protein
VFASSEDFERFLVDRFRRLRNQLVRSVEPRAIDEAERLAADPRFVRLVPDAASEEDVARRIARASGALGAPFEAFARALSRFAELQTPGLALHGTGSWALSGILRDGAIVAGGDGLTGEVAMTNVVERDVFVLSWRSPFAFYAAAAFAHWNAGSRQVALEWSATSAGHVPIDEMLMLLLFVEGDPIIGRGRGATYFRVRDPEADRVSLAALERLVQRARENELPRDLGRGGRRVGPVTPELCEDNLVYAIRTLANGEPMRDAILRWAPRLRAMLGCALPEDSAEERARKAAVVASLAAQHPVVLAVDAVECRADPSYPWSPERRVSDRIPLDRIRVAWVPEAQRAAASRSLPHVEVLPLEDFELLRAVAETPDLTVDRSGDTTPAA